MKGENINDNLILLLKLMLCIILGYGLYKDIGKQLNGKNRYEFFAYFMTYLCISAFFTIVIIMVGWFLVWEDLIGYSIWSTLLFL